MRWIKQRNNFSCATIAILNLMKWLGLRISYKRDYNRIRKKLHCDGSHGTYVRDFEKVIQTIKQAVIQRKRNPTVRDLQKAIDAGYLVILRYKISRYVNHVVVLHKRNHHCFFIVNINKDGHWWYDNAFLKRRLDRGKATAYLIGRNA